MLNSSLTIEDCLELLAGMKGKEQFQILSTDFTILNSIARQVFRGVALTDKQYQLCKTKLLENYKDQFISYGYDIELAVEKIKQPIRSIDRRKYISIVSDLEKDEIKTNDNLLWFCVRFPFSKKLIADIDRCTLNRRTYFHNKGSHKHFFVVNEENVYSILSTFKDKDFNIDQELLEFYEKIVSVKDNPQNYLPSIENYTLQNVNEKVRNLAEAEIGPLNKDTLLYYCDRRMRYGISKITHSFNPVTLAEKIALRDKNELLSKPSDTDIKILLNAINDLQRYPLLVVVDENNAEQQMHETYNYFRHVISSKEQSVLFRLNSDTGSSFNEYVKENNLNNWVDKNTKIVYINNNKLPKILLTCDWRPITALVFGSFPNRYNDVYLKNYCDLIVYRDETLSPFKKVLNF